MTRRLTLLILALLATTAMWAAKTETIKIDTKLVPDSAMAVTIITPEGYAPDGAYPTVYLLNGYSGNNMSWIKHVRPDLPELAEKYGMVIVMPDGRDSWYWNSPACPQMQMESFIVDELVPYVDSHYPTKPCSSQRAISGLSMGGQGAMWLAMHHPDIFGSVGSMSGGLDIRPFPKKWKMAKWLGPKDNNEQIWDDHAIINLVPSLKPGELNITFDCGVDDFFAEVNDNLHVALMAAGVPHDYTSRPGAHTSAYWANSLLYHLLYFNECFNRKATK